MQSRNVSELEIDQDQALSARSVMASLLLGRHPARASARDLVRWCDRFGISAGTARVALHRMTAAGELRRTGSGYELVGGLARRQREQEESLTPHRRRWSGTWRMAVVVGDARPAAVRADVRAALLRVRFAEWREGVWIRPANLDTDEDPRCTWLDARLEDDPVELAARLFAPSEWSRVAVSLTACLETAMRDLHADPSTAIAPAFLTGAAALRHIRADAQLPSALVPQPWPGPTLRARYVTYQRAFEAAARTWFRA